MSNKFLTNLARIIIIIAIIAGIVFSLNILSNAEDNDGVTEKNAEEIRYLDTKLLSIINYINNIDMQNYRVVLTKVEPENSSTSGTSQKEQNSNEEEDSSENGTDKEEKVLSKMEQETIITNQGETDWTTIEGELEILSSTWATIVLDLYKIEVSAEDILNFGNDLDQTILNVKKKDKTLSCMYLAKLYSYLPKFIDKNGTEELKREVLETKTYIINAYAYAETSNWDKMGEEIQKAENKFAGLVNDVKYVNDQRKYNINKSYVLIGELKNSLASKDTGIFYLKYKNTLEELNILD